jgi:hypothetical protein
VAVRLLGFVVLFAALSPLAYAPSAVAKLPPLTVSPESKVDITAKQGKGKASGFVVVVNRGKTSANLSADFEASASSEIEVAGLEPKEAPPGKATRLKVTLAGLQTVKKKVQGELVLSGGAGIVVKTVTITPAPQPSRNWAHDIVLGSLLAAAALFVLISIVVLARARDRGRLFAAAPGPKWNFSDSWATTLTTVGAVLGTVLGSATLPEVPREIDKTTLVGLNLLFGALVVAAPFAFQALRNPSVSPADADAGLWGFNITLLMACSLTFGAVLGELATLTLLGWELIDVSSWRHIAVGVAVAAGVLALYYFVVTAWWLARTDWESLAQAEQPATLSDGREAVVLAPSAPRWSLP